MAPEHRGLEHLLDGFESMIRVGILGATGYTAFELIRLLLRHPEVEITTLTTRQESRPHVSDIHPALTGRLDLHLEKLTAAEVADRTDCIFCCLPHTASAEVVSEYLALGKRVVDFSADYRLNDVGTYEKWYGVTHPDPERVGSVVYGLPELFREQIKGAQVVANPGCFPTSAILGLAPLVEERLIENESIVVDAKTGVSGGGRNPKPALHFPECNEGVSAYGVGTHRHMPEIDEILARACNASVNVVFTPHLIPMDRGILATMYARPVRSVSQESVVELYRSAYGREPFVRIVDRDISTKHTSGTNYCDISVRVVRGVVIVMSAIDNLIKGASGAAVQNMNLMYDLDETTALLA